MKVLIADIETDGLLPDLTRVWCLGVGDMDDKSVVVYADEPGYPPLAEGFTRLKAADRVVFHNGIGFDYPAIERLYPGTLRFEQLFDTLVVARLANPEERHNTLKDWGVRLGFPKGEHSDWTQFSDEMAKYCGQDIRVTGRLYQRLLKMVDGWGESVALEHAVAHCIFLQEQNGFLLDVPKAVALESELRQELTNIERELEPLFPPILVKDGKVFTPKRDKPSIGYVAGAPFQKIKLQAFNPGSRPQIEHRLRVKYGWKPSKFTSSGRAEIDETVLAELDYPEAKQLSRYFRVEKQLGQISDGDNGWLKLVGKDGRVHGRVNPNGAVTGRMTHFAPNMGQVDKKDLRMREVWIARPGRKLVGCDADGLELRMLGHYLSPYDGGAYIDAVTTGDKAKGTDPHSRTQKIVGLYKRDNAKRFIYAMIYGAGNKKLGLIIIEDADEASQPRPKGNPAKIGKLAREKIEHGITGLDRLIRKVKFAHKARGYLVGFDGRHILTRSEHSALNTLLQGGGAVVMKKALVLFHAIHADDYGKHFTYCANVHDEVQMETDPTFAVALGQSFAHSITAAGAALKCRCPLAGTYDIGDNWKDTH